MAGGIPLADLDRRVVSSERKLAALARVAQAIAAGDDLETVLNGVASTMATTLGFPECNIYEYCEATSTFRVLADFDADDPGPTTWNGRVCSEEETGVGMRALVSGQPVVVASQDDPLLGEAERRLMEHFGEHVMLMLPMYFGGRRVGVIEMCDRDPGHTVGEDDVSLAQAMANQAVAAIENAKSLDALRSFHLNSLCTLASALNAKDSYTHGHASRVAAYAVFLCRELGVDPALTAELEKACYLHDIGKIGITDRILQKRGRLTAEERELMQLHASISARIISPLFSGDVLEAVRHHHEAWDGSGYPDGLNAESIPLLARIMHIVDSYDAMSYSRPYAKALPYADAVQELERGAGAQFDPALVAPFLGVLERMQTTRRQADAIAQEAAALIDGDEHSRLVAAYQEDSAVYREMVETLRRVRDKHEDARFITTAVLQPDCARFVLDAEEDEALHSHVGDPYPYFLDSPLLSDTWSSRLDPAELYEDWFSGEENVLYVDQWGIWLCGAAPIRNRRGETVGLINVDVPAIELDSLESGAHRVFNTLMCDVDMQVQTLRVLAITDELTGLYNHRFLQDQLDREINLAGEEMRNVCLVVVDIDNFRAINERYGYAHGDAVLHTVGQAIFAAVEPYDVCARFGGEEFAVVLNDREPAAAAEFGENLRVRLDTCLEKLGDGSTVSVAVAAFPEHAGDREGLVRAVLAALAEAKAKGGDCVAVAAG